MKPLGHGRRANVVRKCGDRPMQWAQTRERGGNQIPPRSFCPKGADGQLQQGEEASSVANTPGGTSWVLGRLVCLVVGCVGVWIIVPVFACDLYAVACEAEQISTENGRDDTCSVVCTCRTYVDRHIGSPGRAGCLPHGVWRMLWHTLAGITAPGWTEQLCIWCAAHVRACAAWHIRTARAS